MTITIEQVRELLGAGRLSGLSALTDAMAAELVTEDDIAGGLAVGRVAQVTGVSAHTLRYYERAGLVAVPRDPAGRRSYDRASVGRILLISRLRLAGMPIRDIAAYLDLVATNAPPDDRLALLREHRERVAAQLDTLRFALAVIDYKITTYASGE